MKTRRTCLHLMLTTAQAYESSLSESLLQTRSYKWMWFVALAQLGFEICDWVVALLFIFLILGRIILLHLHQLQHQKATATLPALLVSLLKIMSALSWELSSKHWDSNVNLCNSEQNSFLVAFYSGHYSSSFIQMEKAIYRNKHVYIKRLRE